MPVVNLRVASVGLTFVALRLLWSTASQRALNVGLWDQSACKGPERAVSLLGNEAPHDVNDNRGHSNCRSANPFAIDRVLNARTRCDDGQEE